MQATFFGGKCQIVTNSTLNFWNLTRNLYYTHYDVLKVKKDSTNKEIKEAFIELSKQYHPDTTKIPNSQGKFVKIVEAYNILGKPELRRSYDLGLAVPQNRSNHSYDYASQRNPADDPIFWHNRDKSQDKYYEDKPYYGIKGLKKVSNGTIVLVCLLITTIGIALQVVAIRSSVTLKRDKMVRESVEAERILANLQEEANRNGNKVQIQKLKQRFEEHSLLKRQDS